MKLLVSYFICTWWFQSDSSSSYAINCNFRARIYRAPKGIPAPYIHLANPIHVFFFCSFFYDSLCVFCLLAVCVGDLKKAPIGPTCWVRILFSSPCLVSSQMHLIFIINISRIMLICHIYYLSSILLLAKNSVISSLTYSWHFLHSVMFRFPPARCCLSLWIPPLATSP